MNLPESFDFTQSNLQDYMECPYRFYLRYILRTKWPALVVEDAVKFEQRGQAGARFHRLVQQYLVGIPEDQLTPSAESDPEAEVGIWWENFLSHVPSWLAGETYTEISLSTNLNRDRLAAKYDLIMVDQNEHKITIIDWKTSQKLPKREWLLERVQTRLYRFLLAQSSHILSREQAFSPENINMVYWFAAFPGSLIRLPYDETTYQKDKRFFSSLLSEIHNRHEENFSKTSDIKKCRYCTYRSHCDRGTQAGDLAGFDDFDIDIEEVETEIDFDDIPEIKF